MSPKQKDLSSSLTLDHFFVHVDLALWDFFSQTFLMSPKDPPFLFFHFAKEWMFKNSQRPFYIFRHSGLTKDQKNISKRNSKKISGIFFSFFPHADTVEENTLNFEFLLLFLSLKYAAVLGRSRLVFKTNEVTDFISFIRWLELTLNATLLLLALEIEVN